VWLKSRTITVAKAILNIGVAVASLGGDTRLKFIFEWLNVVFIFLNSATKKLILVGCHPLEGVTRGGKETTARKGHHSQEARGRENRVTPSVAAPCDTNPS